MLLLPPEAEMGAFWGYFFIFLEAEGGSGVDLTYSFISAVFSSTFASTFLGIGYMGFSTVFGG